MNEQPFELQDDWSEEFMYQEVYHVAMKHEQPVEVKTESETQTMNAPFGKKTDFDYELILVEEPIPSESTVWNHWIDNKNCGMDAVSEANGIDKTQLSKGHRKRPKRTTWKIETKLNLLHEMDERT